MKVLVLTAKYPQNNGTHERMFVHVRNLYYLKKGIEVTVLNFASTEDYVIDGIRVITKKTYERENNNYDILISHASNLRNQFLFLIKHDWKFKKNVFFFHGHEVLYLNKEYPQPYAFVKSKSKLRYCFQDMYDFIKVHIWRYYYKKVAAKSYYVFVSNWIKSKFHEYVGLNDIDLNDHCAIINNSIGAAFENKEYDVACEKIYDFITIRSDLDGSKYGVDIVVNLAEKNPDSKFLLIGKGKYFDYNSKPSNLKWINRTMNHEEMFQFLDQSKCALLFTREDTQGVMTCELAAYGMPVITSNIDVCHEFFDGMPNVALVENNSDIDIKAISDSLSVKLPFYRDTTYYCENKIEQEVSLFKQIVKEG